MRRLIGFVTIQTLFLTGGQVLLKLALEKLDKLEWTREYFIKVLANYWLPACGICFSLALALWLYIIRKFPFSQAYPLTSLSFVFGMIAARLVFDEAISLTRWTGLFLVVGGCFLIMK